MEGGPQYAQSLNLLPDSHVPEITSLCDFSLNLLLLEMWQSKSSEVIVSRQYFYFHYFPPELIS